MKNTRLNRFIDSLKINIDAAVIMDAANKRYITGLNTDDAGTLVVTRNKSYFIIDSRYIEIAQTSIRDNIEVVLQQELFSQISDIFTQNSVKSFCLENKKTSVWLCEKFKKLIESAKCIISVDAGEIINSLRSIKDDTELEFIKRAQSITDDAFDFILGEIKEGKTEKELSLNLEFYMRNNGADATSFDIIFAAGKNSSMPHAVPTDYKIQNGDLITIDFGADFKGYKSDMTRTVAFGSVSDEQKKVYNIVLDAQKAALDKITAGKMCSEIDEIARRYISDRGYGKFFGHALGHSVGLEIHESPNFSPKCNTVLKEGMVLSVEPGIYIPGKFGVRIEDLVYITKNSSLNLTKSNKSLIIL